MKNKPWNISLWILQILLGAAFGMAGFSKLTQPYEMLVEMMVWPGALPVWLVRLIGASELAGALGLVLPGLTRIKPQLTAFAAAGLATVMLLAAGFHLTRGEESVIGINVVLGAIAAFIAYGRWRKSPLTTDPSSTQLTPTT